MIRVTVELISGRTGKASVLGIATIANDVQQTIESRGDLGSYDARFSKWAPKEKEIWKRGRVENFDRRRRGPWDLLYLALKSAVGSRNGG